MNSKKTNEVKFKPGACIYIGVDLANQEFDCSVISIFKNGKLLYTTLKPKVKTRYVFGTKSE